MPKHNKKLSAEVKSSLPYIIMKDLARHFRTVYAEPRIESHPVSRNGAKLCIIIDGSQALTFHLVSVDDHNLKITVEWTIDGMTYFRLDKFNRSNLIDNHADIEAAKARIKEHDKNPFLVVSIIDPQSTTKISEWIGDRLASVMHYADTWNNHRPTSK